ncbi:MAG: asparaginase [Oscillospiraceae bacterium]|nr:asparaginase [Oscillospiraceae bacterium]
MKRILFIGTGGTIASEITENGLLPGLGPEQLLKYVPGLENLCSVDFLQLYDLDSTNIGPDHWLGMAKTIRENYALYDGFVISHGTDTMAYTAAALTYLIQYSPKPIILTGAQKPIGFDTTDSKVNLADSFTAACWDGMHGVAVVFNGRVIAGTRASKTHSKSFDAFSSMNYPNLADVRDGRMLQYIVPEFLPGPLFYDKLCPSVGLLKLTPGGDVGLMEYMINRYDALIVESFGVGGLPQTGGFHDLVRRAAEEEGKTIIMTTQVPNEGSDLAVYNTGFALAGSGRILEAYDMTTEAVLAKVMWILGQTRNSDEIRRLFYTPVSRDILSMK